MLWGVSRAEVVSTTVEGKDIAEGGVVWVWECKSPGLLVAELTPMPTPTPNAVDVLPLLLGVSGVVGRYPAPVRRYCDMAQLGDVAAFRFHMLAGWYCG